MGIRIRICLAESTLNMMHLLNLPSYLLLCLPLLGHVQCLPAGGGGQYRGYQVLSITPDTEDQVSWLVTMKENSSTTECDTDWWSEPSKPGVSVAVSIAPDCLAGVEEMVKETGMEYNVTITDLEELIDEEKSYRFLVLLHKAAEDWTPEIYHNLREIERRLDWLVSTYSDLVSRQHLGTTHEGRKIEALVVKEDSSFTKPVIWLDCGIHAREWVSPPACLHAIDQLIENSNSVDPQENLLMVYDFYILPVANPDGYVYSWESNRMWRKNRRPITGQQAQAPAFAGWGGQLGAGWGGQQTSSKCGYGVDPNRNFPTNFYQGSDNPCDDSYHGDRALSEAESQAIQRGVQIMKSKYGEGRIAAFVSIHAYSQFWMSPFGYKKDHSKDYKDHMSVMKKSIDALASVYGTQFTYGPISEVIYIASGSSVDWAYENSGIKYSFGLELRDRGQRGFMLPQSQIQPTVQETWVGLTAMARAIAPEFGITQL